MPLARIRRVYDDLNARDRRAVDEAQRILRVQFPGIPEHTVLALPEQVRNPLASRFRTMLFVAEGTGDEILGFALVHHAPDLAFCYLDFISTLPKRVGGGIGGALYARVREEAAALGARGLFFECLPDEPELCRDAAALKQNRARLRFYERYGACPIAGTRYETPLEAGGDQPPFLVYDPLARTEPLMRDEARRIVRAILERRYGAVCPPEYIDMVVESFVEDPVRTRPPRYAGKRKPLPHLRTGERKIALVVNHKHDIHHIRERGYVEAPVRVSAILGELDRVDLFARVEPRAFGDEHVTAVHDPEFVVYLEKVCGEIGEKESVYPYVFPIRNVARPPDDLAIRAGYYCIDTFTPLNGNAFKAARGAVDCALTAAECILAGDWLAYALVRPPGHHAETRSFGGFCYLNTAAIAANRLSAHGRVAILDIDYHHGNGQQDIFWRRSDVLTVSLHGHPRFAYPYFSGFEDELGEGDGWGYNANFALPEELDGDGYREALRGALVRIVKFAPTFLVVALGLDPAKGDPTGTWALLADDFETNGELIGGLGLPTLVIQEGGYLTRSLGRNARRFFTGLWRGAHEVRAVG